VWQRRKKVFISYRRDDTAHVAGRIYDRLVKEFGTRNVFKDVDSIPVAEDFDEYIRKVIPEANLFLALIGPTWTESRDSFGKLRLQNPNDYVVIEIERAFQVPSVKVVPLLIDGAAMPTKSDLPFGIRRLATINGARIRQDPDFHPDMSRMLDAVRKPVRTVAKGSSASGPDLPNAATHNWDNYIVPVGLPGRGKSTFQSHLLRYLQFAPDLRFNVKAVLDRDVSSTQNVLLRWQRDWATNRFPPATTVNTFDLLDFEALPTSKSRAPLKFGIVSVSGEMLAASTRALRAGDNAPSLLRSLTAILANPMNRLSFAFILNPRYAGPEDDLLFSTFIDYVAGIVSVEKPVEARCKITILVAGPEHAAAALEKRRGSASVSNYTEPDLLELLFKATLPQTAGRLKSSSMGWNIMPFSVGPISIDSGGEEFMANPEFDDIKDYFDFVHKFFTESSGSGGGIVDQLRQLLSGKH
jgi:hypothetical protein